MIYCIFLTAIEIAYQASSPDEAALVGAARFLGYEFSV